MCRARISTSMCLLLFAALASATPLFPASRALLIGIDYEGSPHLGSSATLPGIDLDIDMMKDVVSDLGVADVRVLWNEQATLAGFHRAFQELGRGLAREDLVIVYYSGHGGQAFDESGDESDKKDEILIPFDAGRGARGLINVLLDEELGDLLRGIPSDKVVLIVDACNSGTGAKAYGPRVKAYSHGPDDGQRKMGFAFGGEPSSARANADQTPETAPATISSGPVDLGKFEAPEAKYNFVGLMAARDHEFALATHEGSVLTTSIRRVISQALGRGASGITVQDLFLAVEREVAALTGRMARRNPNISQHPQLLAENVALRSLELPLATASSAAPPGPSDDALISHWLDFVHGASELVPLTASRQVFRPHPAPQDPDRSCSMPEHLLTIEVTAPRDGYLTLINAGEAEKEAVVLFPNRYQPDNRVAKGQTIRLPPPNQTKWCLPATLPPGRNSQTALIVAVFGEKDINLYRNGQGSGPFRTAPAGARSFMVGSGTESSSDNSFAASAAVFVIRR